MAQSQNINLNLVIAGCGKGGGKNTNGPMVLLQPEKEVGEHTSLLGFCTLELYPMGISFFTSAIRAVALILSICFLEPQRKTLRTRFPRVDSKLEITKENTAEEQQ